MNEMPFHGIASCAMAFPYVCSLIMVIVLPVESFVVRYIFRLLNSPLRDFSGISLFVPIRHVRCSFHPTHFVKCNFPQVPLTRLFTMNEKVFQMHGKIISRTMIHN